MTRKALCLNDSVILMGSKPEHDAQIEQACTELQDWAMKDDKPMLNFRTMEIEIVPPRSEVDIAAVVGAQMYQWRNAK